MQIDGGPTLRELTDDDVDDVVAVAADGAAPLEVMPPDDHGDETAWTQARRRAYGAFLRSRLRPLPDGRHERTYLVVADGDTVGLARLLPGSDGDVDAGLWLTRPRRGRGVAGEVFRLLVPLARDQGGRRLVADTTADNIAARRVLARGGARLSPRTDDADTVDAALDL